MLTNLQKMTFGLFFLGCVCAANAGTLNSGTNYEPLVTCNNQAVTMYQVYAAQGSSSDATGVLAISPAIAGGFVSQLVSVSKITGSFETGMSFSTQAYGMIKIDGNGNGLLNYQGCTQTGNGVNCQKKQIKLHCKYVPLIPTGFSAGN